jgi:sugar lactone lactonase YvrE
MRDQLDLVVNLGCTIGEGPVWDAAARTVYWVDLLENAIHAREAGTGKVSSLDVGQNTGCVAPRSKGGLVAALQHGFFLIDMKSGSIEPISDPEADRPENRFNDGKCDCRGRFWAGTMSKKLDTGAGESGPVGNVYCLGADLRVTRKMADITLSNGMGWSPDNRTFYYIDSPTNTVAAWDFDLETGSISGRRVVVRMNQGSVGMPDGMCVDSEGMLWVALWGGAGIGRWDPSTGKLVRRLEVPALNVTSCTFGGPRLDELYITTAKLGTDLKAWPHAGALFCARVGVTGLPSVPFAG